MNQSGDFLRDRFVERVILLTLLAFLVFACVQIVQPFIGPLLWGIIITVATWHPYRWLSDGLGGRRTLAAVIMALALLLILVVPVSMLVNSLAEGVGAVAGLLRDLTTFAAARAADLAARPAGRRAQLDEQWREAMVDLPASLAQLQPYIGTAAGYGLSFGAGLGVAMIEFLVAIVIAGDPVRHRRDRPCRCCAASWPDRRRASPGPARRRRPDHPRRGGRDHLHRLRPGAAAGVRPRRGRRARSGRCWAFSPSSCWSCSSPTGWSGCRSWSGSATAARPGYADLPVRLGHVRRQHGRQLHPPLPDQPGRQAAAAADLRRA